MNRTKEPRASRHASKCVLSLPCGHQVFVELDATLLALSGPVLDHQATCRPERSASLPAWFPLESVPPEEPGPRTARIPIRWGPVSGGLTE